MFDKFADSRLRLLVDPQIAAVEKLNRLQMFDKFADFQITSADSLLSANKSADS